MRAPQTEKDKSSKRKRMVITVFAVVVVLAILAIAAFFSESPFLLLLLLLLLPLLPGSADAREDIPSDPFPLPSLSFPTAVKQLIDSKYFFCKRSVRFIPLAQACDGRDDCAGGEDELTCLSSLKVNTTFPGKD